MSEGRRGHERPPWSSPIAAAQLAICGAAGYSASMTSLARLERRNIGVLSNLAGMLGRPELVVVARTARVT